MSCFADDKCLLCAQVRDFIYRSGKGAIAYSDFERAFDLSLDFNVINWFTAFKEMHPNKCDIHVSVDEDGSPVRLDMYRYNNIADVPT